MNKLCCLYKVYIKDKIKNKSKYFLNTLLFKKIIFQIIKRKLGPKLYIF
jgi:hypothetical protein